MNYHTLGNGASSESSRSGKDNKASQARGTTALLERPVSQPAGRSSIPQAAQATYPATELVDDETVPDLVQLRTLPGPASMHLLLKRRLIDQLDSSCSYLRARANSLFGRASIVEPLLPFGAPACNSLASWVWTGGIFPDNLDIISRSHFRTPVYSHFLRVHNRQLPNAHLMKLGSLWATSPLRTACDLACDDSDQEEHPSKLADLHTLMERYQVTCGACLNLLEENPRWPGHSAGVETFLLLRRIM